MLLAIVVVLVATTLFDSQHTYLRNPRPSAVDILRQTSMLGIFAIGSAIVIIAGGIDLSSGSMITFSGTICASLMMLMAPEAMTRNQPLGTWVIVVACTAAIFSGFLVGSLHAWLITVVGLPPFVATLATLVGLRSLSRALVAYVNKGSTQIPIFDVGFRYLATSVWIPAVLCIVLAVLFWLVMSRTVVGRHLYALGGNENAAKLSGIRTDRLKWLAYCISAMLSAVAGILHVAEVAVIEP
ncbi:MAG TPA: ABC transporter permease, partial [Gemmataceae bacterium]|nr:ABC transporter permease [Gemmataceae bacterium]